MTAHPPSPNVRPMTAPPLSYAAVLRRMAARAAYTHDEDTCELVVGADTAPCTCGVTADLHALRALAALVEAIEQWQVAPETTTFDDSCERNEAIGQLIDSLAAGFDPPMSDTALLNAIETSEGWEISQHLTNHTGVVHWRHGSKRGSLRDLVQAALGEAGSAPKLESLVRLNPETPTET